MYKEAAMYNEELMALFKEDETEYLEFNQKTGLDIDDASNYLIGIKEYKFYTFPFFDSNGEVLKIEEMNKHEVKKDNIRSFLFHSYKQVDIRNVVDAAGHGKNVTFDAIVIGKDLSPYLIPKRVSLKCNEVWAKVASGKVPDKCLSCVLFNENYLNENKEAFKTYSVNENTNALVKMVGLNDTQINGEIRKMFEIPPYDKCRHVDVEILERISVEDVSLVSEINYERLDSDYIMTQAFVFGKKTKPNQQYKVWGKIWSNPNNQKAVQVLHYIDSERDNISKWKITEENKQILNIFKPKEDTVEAIEEKMNEINRDLTANVTRMKKREDVITITNMIYHSALNFNFMGHYINKGWMEGAVLGDTRTGKTETARNLLMHYRAGEFISSAENTTVAGLIGGLQQTSSGRWNLTWGRLPLNDKRLVIIDESDELAKSNSIGFLSGVRSSGVAEIIKVQQQKTMSRTRLIFISNGFKGRVSDYNYGVDILKDLFPEQQDISRVDVAVVCKKEDVSDQEINTRNDSFSEVPHVYTKEACHTRVMFAWTLDHNKIKFTPECEGYILNQANKMGEKYSPEIPLVIGAEFRIKLARAAISVAAQMFSWDGEFLIVKECHAQYYSRWIQKIYDSTTFGYLDYSEQIKSERLLTRVDRLDELFKELDVVNEVLKTGNMTMGDVQDIFIADQQQAREIIGLMRKGNAIIKKSGYYYKTPQFINYLKQKRRITKGDNVL